MGGTFDYTGLKKCKNLEILKINNFNKEQIDLSENNNLIELDINDFRNVIGVEFLLNLKKIICTRPSKKFLTHNIFSNFSELEFLCISNANLEQGLEFLSSNININRLDIYSCGKLSLSGLNELE